MGYAEAQYTVDEVINALQQMGANESGIPPIKPWVTVVPAAQSVKVYFTIKDTVIENQTVCHCKGVMIRKKLGSPITSLTDGDLVGIYEDDEARSHGDNGTPITISGLENGVWVWIGVWAFSDHNVYNLDMSNVYQVQPGADIIYGFHQDFTDLNPDTCITYIGANASFQPMHTISHKIVENYAIQQVDGFTYGSWKTWSWLNKVQPFLTEGKQKSTDSSVPEYNRHYRYRKLNRLNAFDYVRDADTGEIIPEISGKNSATTITSAGCDMFVWFPRIYMKEVYSSDGNSRDVYFSETKQTSATHDFYPMGFQDPDDNEVNGIWIACGYPYYGIDSPSSKTTTTLPVPSYSSGNANMLFGGSMNYMFGAEASQYRNIFSETNTSYDLAYFGGVWHFLVRDLLYMLYKSTNIGAHAGKINSSGLTFSTASQQPNLGMGNTTVSGFFKELTTKSGMFRGVNGINGNGFCKLFHSWSLGYRYPLRDPNIVLKNKTQVYIITNGNYDENFTSAKQTNVHINTWTNIGTGPHYPAKLVYLGNGKGSMAIGENAATSTTGLCSPVTFIDVTPNLDSYPPSSTDRFLSHTFVSNNGIEGYSGYQAVDKNSNQSTLTWASNSFGIGIIVAFPPTNYTPYDDYEGGVPSQW